MRPARSQQGLVLVVVLFFALLLTSSTATFVRRATMDASIVRNREAVAAAEGLARGGLRLAEALLAEDLRREIAGGRPGDSAQDVWARVGEIPLPEAADATLDLSIEDAGARLNLNALPVNDPVAAGRTELFLVALLEKWIDAMPGRPEEKTYDPLELARNLIDWMDEDRVRRNGGDEAEPYQRREPAYRPSDRPLLSVDELRLVEGFDGRLVDALRPYVGVYPLAGGAGINPNTAPPWVLSLLFHGVAGELRLADEDEVRELLRLREEGRIICPEGVSDDRCVPIYEATHAIQAGDEIFPPLALRSRVFRVVARARVGDVERTLEVILDRNLPSLPERLAWRMS